MPNQEAQELSDEEIIVVVQDNELELSKSIDVLYARQDLRKIAFKNHRDYQRNLNFLSWEDIYYESIIRLVVSIQMGRFQGKAKLSHYFSQICRNYCGELVRKNKEIDADRLDTDWVINPEKLVLNEEAQKVLRDLLQEQSAKCLKIFELLFYKAKAWEMVDIAEEVGLSNARTAITTYHRCKKKLIQQIENNQALKQLFKSYL